MFQANDKRRMQSSWSSRSLLKPWLWQSSSGCLGWMFAVMLVVPCSVRADAGSELFESKIRPVLADTCFRCHGDQKSGGMLRVDSREALLKGGDSGPAIVPGKPDDSLLIQAIARHDGVSAMPPEKDKALRPDQVADFVKWISTEADWPATTKAFEAKHHWALEPVQDVEIPTVQDRGWIKTTVDSFIRARQEGAGVQPAAPADKRTLIRRATFDLTGLPPTPEEIDAFVRDESPAAFQVIVDRLLKSSAYGERWGRHWLDVVRYADTAGETADYPVPVAWRYRNYVIDAFNADKPYDEFLREQIAGDVLAQQGPKDRYAERTTATGYLAISRRFGFDSENYHHLTIQDTIDTLGQSVLGLSLGCARCHDHKFDPVTMRDYYGLYGIFDSSRYAFPGSEQKQRVRSMVPLMPPEESLPKWREFDRQVASIMTSLEQQKQPVPAAILRPLNDIDGDFELQAAAAGGSNGVLVHPWLYEGNIAVTNAAQSPFKNLYPRGKSGFSIPAGSVNYRVTQAIFPRRLDAQHPTIDFNLDFRVTPADGSAGMHRVWLGSTPGTRAVEVLISADAIFVRTEEALQQVATVERGQWQNLQLRFDHASKTISGRFGTPGRITPFSGIPFAPDWGGTIDFVYFNASVLQGENPPAIEFDNVGLEQTPIAEVSLEPVKTAASTSGADPVALTKELDDLTGFDGDVELQLTGLAPSRPWWPGPNSVVKIEKRSQSPFTNLFAPGEVGIHMPNRGEYDGFGRSLVDVKPGPDGKLSASFDFRCAAADAGGSGSWRYYIGHGPGPSAAVELFFNGREFFRRSADAREPVCALSLGEWYQVQLTLDVTNRTYTGLLLSADRKVEFSGQLATGWDGIIDYTFIDSYGHIGGVRPSIDADNFLIATTSLPSLEVRVDPTINVSRETRLARVQQLREQLALLAADAELSKQQLNQMLAEGPYPMAYGVVEGTPHSVRMQMRGEPDHPGPLVERGFIKSLGGDPLSPETTGSGRMELARWLTQPQNPLTARVMVNRIWLYHFGRGLVKTPNDFGVRGLPPTHPELLDHLARQFVQGGWSIKSMHRLIMLSSTYQQAAIASSANPASVDTSDLYVQFSRRRLSAEEIRDSILAVSGELDSIPGQGHPFPAPTSWGYSQHGPFAAVYDHNKRSVYLMSQRLKRHPFLALFDGADPNASTADRLGTTVPTQALFFLNDPFVHQKSDRFAARLRMLSPDLNSQIEIASRLAIGRTASEAERAEAVRFCELYRTELVAAGHPDPDAGALAAYVRTIFGSNEFLYVD